MTTPDPIQPIQEGLNRYWSAYAQDYDSHQSARLDIDGELEAWQRVWADALGDEQKTVLDVGTGTGHAARIIASLGDHVTGVDLAEGMLRKARQKSPINGFTPTFLHADAANPPMEPGSIDAITARYFLWTLRSPQHALTNWLKLLRPGGKLAVVDSLWFPEGLLASPLTSVADRRMRDFRTAYAPALPELPLAEETNIQHFATLVDSAGFCDVAVTELTELLDRDKRYGVADHHRPQMNYLITASRPQ